MIVAIQMALPSVANLREHWSKRAKRVKAQRAAVALAMRSERRKVADIRQWLLDGKPLRVVMNRLAPRKLDSDNLASAFKGIRDQIASELGVNDGSDQVDWVCTQTTGAGNPTAVIIAFTDIDLEADPPPPFDEDRKSDATHGSRRRVVLEPT